MFVRNIYDVCLDSCLVLLDPLLVSGDDLLELVHVGPGEVSHLGLILNEDEGGHGSDLVFSCHLLHIVHIHLSSMCTLNNLPSNTQMNPTVKQSSP